MSTLHACMLVLGLVQYDHPHLAVACEYAIRTVLPRVRSCSRAGRVGLLGLGLFWERLFARVGEIWRPCGVLGLVWSMESR